MFLSFLSKHTHHIVVRELYELV